MYKRQHFNPNNAFDAEGLTKLTQETERRRRERNEVEQDVEVAVREDVYKRQGLDRMLPHAHPQDLMQKSVQPLPKSLKRTAILLTLGIPC